MFEMWLFEEAYLNYFMDICDRIKIILFSFKCLFYWNNEMTKSGCKPGNSRSIWWLFHIMWLYNLLYWGLCNWETKHFCRSQKIIMKFMFQNFFTHTYDVAKERWLANKHFYIILFLTLLNLPLCEAFQWLKVLENLWHWNIKKVIFNVKNSHFNK